MLKTDLFFPRKWVKFLGNGDPITTDGYVNKYWYNCKLAQPFWETT